ncbi:hypothetical protein GW7_08765 [Heterocephalus glaber]|uniref:Uncharacterized protein n=1 Tax=Heterocephalus glaber TaxID=10181 RepID=G5BBJ6_HETGA|nr:hypothetical protein GW7_08765 [Heterocephalus glaber]
MVTGLDVMQSGMETTGEESSAHSRERTVRGDIGGLEQGPHQEGTGRPCSVVLSKAEASLVKRRRKIVYPEGLEMLREDTCGYGK